MFPYTTVAVKINLRFIQQSLVRAFDDTFLAGLDADGHTHCPGTILVYIHAVMI